MEEQRIIEIICSLYNIGLADVYKKRTDYTRCGDARHYCWYFMHYHALMTTKSIANKFERTPNAVKKGIAKIKFLIGHVKEYNNRYQEILSIIKKKE